MCNEDSNAGMPEDESFLPRDDGAFADDPRFTFPPEEKQAQAKPLPPLVGRITVPERMTVLELADALKQKPFQIIASLMEVGTFVTLHQQITFDLIAQVARGYGYEAEKEV